MCSICKWKTTWKNTIEKWTLSLKLTQYLQWKNVTGTLFKNSLFKVSIKSYFYFIFLNSWILYWYCSNFFFKHLTDYFVGLQLYNTNVAKYIQKTISRCHKTNRWFSFYGFNNHHNTNLIKLTFYNIMCQLENFSLYHIFDDPDFQ